MKWLSNLLDWIENRGKPKLIVRLGYRFDYGNQKIYHWLDENGEVWLARADGKGLRVSMKELDWNESS